MIYDIWSFSSSSSLRKFPNWRVIVWLVSSHVNFTYVSTVLLLCFLMHTTWYPPPPTQSEVSLQSCMFPSFLKTINNFSNITSSNFFSSRTIEFFRKLSICLPCVPNFFQTCLLGDLYFIFSSLAPASLSAVLTISVLYFHYSL